jgi:hypothetical protein
MVRKRKASKTRRKRDDSLKADILGMLQDQGIERAADYARRGRRHADLSQADLLQAWIARRSGSFRETRGLESSITIYRLS